MSGANSGRDHIVGQIRDAGFRVEGDHSRIFTTILQEVSMR